MKISDNINKEFGIYRYLRPPFNKFIFKISSPFLNLFFLNLKDDNLFIKKIKVKINAQILKIIMFMPKEKTQKAMIYFHRGGFAFKGAPYHFKLCKKYALEGKCAVFYVDYPLIPKHVYPSNRDCCLSSYSYIVSHYSFKEYYLGGDSAGGNLAIEVLDEIIQNNLLIPQKLMLIYPVIDPYIETESKLKFDSTPMWNTNLNKKMWNLYLKGQKYVSIYKRKNISSFCKTYIETCEFDCLKDEAIMFMNTLKDNNIDVTYYFNKEAMHGFDLKMKAKITCAAIKKRIEFLKD